MAHTNDKHTSSCTRAVMSMANAVVCWQIDYGFIVVEVQCEANFAVVLHPRTRMQWTFETQAQRARRVHHPRFTVAVGAELTAS